LVILIRCLQDKSPDISQVFRPPYSDERTDSSLSFITNLRYVIGLTSHHSVTTSFLILGPSYCPALG
jgi:hypothetical protein